MQTRISDYFHLYTGLRHLPRQCPAQEYVAVGFTEVSVVVLVLVFNVDNDVVEVAFVVGDDVVDVVLEVGAVLDITGQEAAALLYMSAVLRWPLLYPLAAKF